MYILSTLNSNAPGMSRALFWNISRSRRRALPPLLENFLDKLPYVYSTVNIFHAYYRNNNNRCKPVIWTVITRVPRISEKGCSVTPRNDTCSFCLSVDQYALSSFAIIIWLSKVIFWFMPIWSTWSTLVSTICDTRFRSRSFIEDIFLDRCTVNFDTHI